MGSSGIDIASLADAAKDPQTAGNVLQFLDEANKAISKIDSIISTFQKWGLSPSIVEKIAIKYGELDKVPSLPKSDNLITPASGTHKMMFDALNQMSEQQLNELAKQMQEQGKDREEPKKRK